MGGGGFGTVAAEFFVAGPLLHQDLFEVFLALDAVVEVLRGRDEAEFGVGDDLVDGIGGVGGLLRAREVEGGDLESVEEESGAAGVEVVGGEAGEDVGDGVLDAAALVGAGEGEGGAAGLLVEPSLAGVEFPVWDGFAGGVVVVAKIFFAECGTAAAMAAGEDVAALETDVGCRLIWHMDGGPPPPGTA